ncbi:MAG: hypothetical protein ACE5E4_13410 [Candidatus Binatia bacterium]
MRPKREIDYKRLLELFWEFSRKIEELHTLYLDSVVGFKLLHDQLLRRQDDVQRFLGEHEYATAAFQDTCSVAYRQLGGSDLSPVSMSPVMKQGDLKDRTREDGKNLLLLGSQCVVAAYAYWEEYLRIEIGIAIGVLPQGATNSEGNRATLNEHVTSDFWGDMRQLRNSILHKNGIANSDMSKCKIIRWFPPGTPIELTFERMQRIFLLMGDYRNELHSMSLPPREPIRIPDR